MTFRKLPRNYPKHNKSTDMMVGFPLPENRNRKQDLIVFFSIYVQKIIVQKIPPVGRVRPTGHQPIWFRRYHWTRPNLDLSTGIN